MVCEAYLVTSSVPRALMSITLSNTAISLSIGVAISPPQPPHHDTPQVGALKRGLDAGLVGKGRRPKVRQPVFPGQRLQLVRLRPLAITSAPAAMRVTDRRGADAPPAPVTRMGPLSKPAMTCLPVSRCRLVLWRSGVLAAMSSLLAIGQPLLNARAITCIAIFV